MEIIIKGEAKEIAALVLVVQGRQTEDVAEEVCAEFSKRLHQKIKDQLEVSRSSREPK